MPKRTRKRTRNLNQSRAALRATRKKLVWVEPHLRRSRKCKRTGKRNSRRYYPVSGFWRVAKNKR